MIIELNKNYFKTGKQKIKLNDVYMYNDLICKPISW